MTVLVVVERTPDGVHELSLQAVAFARRYAADEPVHALVVGESDGARADSSASTASRPCTSPSTTRSRPTRPPPSLARRSSSWPRRAASAVVAAGNERGNEVLAHVAAIADLPFAANCIEATPGDPALVTRVRWGGSLLEEARLHGTPKLMTVQPHAVAAGGRRRGARRRSSASRPRSTEADLVVRVRERVGAATGGVSLAEAKVVVSCGRGAGSPEGFGIIEELAGLLGGAVGCSRAVTMAGWRPHTDQVGQTGTKIAPDIYIACGISGATQHMAGCKGAKAILAVNTDPEAPILASADYAVIGDLHEVVPAISAELRKAKAG